MFTSWTLSQFLGSPTADILASIAVVALLLPLLLKITRVWCMVALYGTAALAALPISIASVAFDYSPVLIVYQVLLVRLHCEDGHACFVRHGAFSAVFLVAATTWCAAFGITPSTSVFAVLFGHPLAAVLIKAFMDKEVHHSTTLTKIASKPLTVYAIHLLVFALLANFLGMTA